MIFLSHHFSNDDELFSFSVFEFPRFSKTLFMPHCPTWIFRKHPATYSGFILPVIPETCCHAFRDYPATGVD
jgi:hypothetical protein